MSRLHCHYTSRWIFLLVTGLLLQACEPAPTSAAAPIGAAPTAPEPPASQLISNVIVYDGTGAAGVAGAVRIEDGKIVAVGLLDALPGETIIDGGGQVLAPGFIDTHSHADSDLAAHPDATAAVSQGITTIIAGQDGSSHLPLQAFMQQFEASPAAVNFASYVGHNTLRGEVMGGDYKRVARADEVERMETLLLRELDAGALGLAGGLEYDPGIYSDPAEVLQLARVTAQQGGRYISHMRSEDRHFEQALAEIIQIGRETGMPVQISHFKLAMKRLWGTAPDVLARLDAARAEGIDITADIYPYEYWQSNLMVMLPGRDVNDRQEIDLALSELAPPDGIWLTQFDPQPEYVGKTLTEIAALRGTDAATAFADLIIASEALTATTGEPADMMIGTSMTEEDILNLLSWPHTNLCTDGGLVDLHPRARGSYPRVLGRYVRELGRLELAEALHKMSGLAALHMGITDRGLIRPGLAADLVLFDPATVIDHATPQNPEALSTGITTVWVNGEPVWDDGAATGNLPGVVIRRAAAAKR